ncbi:MAG: trimethylamine methyltransferase family protein [Vulcanimicrobiota bacterium]
MVDMLETIRPRLNLLSAGTVNKIIDEAFDILEKVGIFVEHDGAVKMLREAGADYDEISRKTFFPRKLVEQSLKTVPPQIRMYDSQGELSLDLSGDNIHFDPGSAAINFLDYETGGIRKGMTADFVNLSVLVENLKNVDAQSTSFICYDVPEEIGDRYRLYLALKHCSKPIITGIFQEDGWEIMKDMLLAVRGSEKALKEKPLAIFDACPSPPLKWSQLTTGSLIKCARMGIPSEMVSMPLAGATAPVTIMGSVTQHCAECLAGIVISQVAQAGAPIIWGGSPSIFDMKKGTTPMGAIETMMIDVAYAQVGKELNIPTHAYLGLTDSKLIDAQAGFETGMGAVMAALGGINVISGGGLMDFESLFSFEKLVIDNEIFGMVKRLARGVEPRETPFARDLYEEFEKKGHFLSIPHTMKWFRKEFYMNSPVVERAPLGEWQNRGKTTIEERAHERVEQILSKGEKFALSEGKTTQLDQIMLDNARKFGMDKLPE